MSDPRFSQVDKVTAIDSLNAHIPSIAIGRFEFVPGRPPKWNTFTIDDLELLVIPADTTQHLDNSELLSSSCMFRSAGDATAITSYK